MATLKEMIEKMIVLREQGVYMTLLAVCPNSEAVLEAAVKVAARTRAPMLFAATLNQVDRDGGYTGWTPNIFVEKLKALAETYDCHPRLYPCLDHGGPWLKDDHFRERLSFEVVTQEMEASLTTMLESGYQLFHIDATVDPTLDGVLPIETVVERTLDLISHVEAERERLGVPLVDYEVGTEEVHGGLTDPARFEQFLESLRAGLAQRGLVHVWPAFMVAEVGTDLHTTTFDKAMAATLYPLVAQRGTLIKGHYSDWVENPADYPLVGMGGANVGPEFATVEFDALARMEERESHTGLSPSKLMETLTQAVVESDRWRKWLQPHEAGFAFDELAPARCEWIVKTCARYCWTHPSVLTARERLYHHLPEAHEYVLARIERAIQRYVEAFHLRDAIELL